MAYEGRLFRHGGDNVVITARSNRFLSPLEWQITTNTIRKHSFSWVSLPSTPLSKVDDKFLLFGYGQIWEIVNSIA
jgi:hypothetical protein